MDVPGLARTLHRDARRSNERRVLVLAGERSRGHEAVAAVLDALAVPIRETVAVGTDERFHCECVPGDRADRLLGTTQSLVVFDAHERLEPNALGAVVGAVDGGGLLVLCTPQLESWPERRDAFDETLVVDPYDVDAVSGHFRNRFVETLTVHPGVAIVDVDDETVVKTGSTDTSHADVSTSRVEEAKRRKDDARNRVEEAKRWKHELRSRENTESTGEKTGAGDDGASDRPSGGTQFPAAASEACLTGDQANAVAAFETLFDAPQAVVLEADRGRGKSAAAGIAAGCFAAAGWDVAVTAPRRRSAAELFTRAEAVLSTLGHDPSTPNENDAVASGRSGDVGTAVLEIDDGGSIAFTRPVDLESAAERADVLLVDEAAGLPVSRLAAALTADRVGFATTIHGYEGAGMGFSVRFRAALEDARHAVTEVSMTDPIRHAAGDPIEAWSFRALLLDARPVVDLAIEGATPETVSYRALEPVELVADEHRLREVFGLLVLAHYRTEPNDLARLLDAPNLTVRALLHEGHVASVALLAREGGLPPTRRRELYEGGRIRGHMLPDVLTSQLGDEAAGEPVGWRVVRIATHPAVRTRGLGSHLLAAIREEFADAVDWLGAGFGATPELLSFWRENGYGAIHCSTTRNETSGEYSAIVLSPTSEAGAALTGRHARWFARRLSGVLSDTLSDLDPDVVRELLRSVPAAPPVELTAQEWRVVAGATFGTGLFDVDPGPFRSLVVASLIEESSSAGDAPSVELTPREERLLVMRVLQARPWPVVAEALGYHSTRQCMRAFGDAMVPIVDRFGGDVAASVRERFSG